MMSAMSFGTAPLTTEDQELLEAAQEVIAANYEPERHRLGAAVRMGDGRVFTGVHVEAYVGRVTLCAEAVAIGAALSAGARDVQRIVAVAQCDGEARPSATVVAPCGMCRELIGDFGPDARVIVPTADGPPGTALIGDLLPAKYTRD
jgi:cytidine deaminase